MDVPSTAAGTRDRTAGEGGDKVRKGALHRAPVAAGAAPAAASPQSTARGHAVAVAGCSCCRAPYGRMADAWPTASARAAGAGRGPRRLHGGVPRRRPGLAVTLVERWESLGGVCLNVGCIPSKALLHAAKVIEEAEAMAAHGIGFGAPQIDLDRLRSWKGSVVTQAHRRPRGLAKQRKVEVRARRRQVRRARTCSRSPAPTARVQRIGFEQCIIAAGSESVRLPFMPQDPRIMDSTGALELPDVPARLLVIGGGIIGLEMACVYDALGRRLSVVELTDQLMPGCDRDLVQAAGEAPEGALRADPARHQGHEGRGARRGHARELRGCGRGRCRRSTTACWWPWAACPTAGCINAAAAGVTVNERGFIRWTRQMRTNVPHIFAIGDIAGQPMLAHKATHEAKVAAEVAAGHKAFFDARVHPVGGLHGSGDCLGRRHRDGRPRRSGCRSARARSRGPPAAARSRSGATRASPSCIFDADSNRVIGGGIVGPNAGRTDRRDRPGDRDGRRCGRRRPHDSPAPDAVRDRGHGGRGVRRHADRSVHAPQALSVATAAGLQA